MGSSRRSTIAGSLRAILLALVVVASPVYSQATRVMSLHGPDVTNVRFKIADSGGSADLGVGVRWGLAAAFEEVNRAGGVQSFNLSLQALDDQYVASNTVVNVRSFINQSLFGIVGLVGTPTVKAALPYTNSANFPLIGSFTGTGAIRTPFNKYYVNIRAGYPDETAGAEQKISLRRYFVFAQLKSHSFPIVVLVATTPRPFSLHRPPMFSRLSVEAMVKYLTSVLLLNRISVYVQDDAFGQVGIDGVNASMTAIGMPIHSLAKFDRNCAVVTCADSYFTSGINTLLSGVVAPQAIVMVGTYGPLSRFVNLYRADPRSNGDSVIFMTVSFVGASSLMRALALTNDTRNVLVTNVVPNPWDTRLALIPRYQSALAKVCPSCQPDFTSLEGYITGRVVAAVLQWTPSLTNTSRESFLNILYDTPVFQLDGLRLGPYYPSTVSGGCNQGLRQIWTTKYEFNATLGSYEFQLVPEAGLAWDSTCFFDYANNLKRPYHFGQIYELGSSIGSSISTGLALAFKQINTELAGVYGHMLNLRSYAVSNGSQSVERLNFTISADRVLGLTGLQGRAEILDPVYRLALSQAGANNSVVATTGVPVLPVYDFVDGNSSFRSPFVQSILNIRPSSYDELFAQASHLAATGHSDISILYENTTFGTTLKNEAVIALMVNQVVPLTVTTFSPCSNIGCLDEELAAVIAGPVDYQTELIRIPTAILLLTQDLWTIKTAIVQVPALISASVTETRSKRETFVLGSWVDAESSLLFLQSASANGNASRIVWSSVVPLPTDTSYQIVVDFQRAVTMYSAPVGTARVAALEGFITAKFIALNIERVLSADSLVDGSKLLGSVYFSSVFLTGGFRAGPFSYTTLCDPTDERCACNQGSRTIFLFDLTSNAGNMTYASTIQYDGCGAPKVTTYTGPDILDQREKYATDFLYGFSRISRFQPVAAGLVVLLMVVFLLELICSVAFVIKKYGFRIRGETKNDEDNENMASKPAVPVNPPLIRDSVDNTLILAYTIFDAIQIALNIMHTKPFQFAFDRAKSLFTIIAFLGWEIPWALYWSSYAYILGGWTAIVGLIAYSSGENVDARGSILLVVFLAGAVVILGIIFLYIRYRWPHRYRESAKADKVNRLVKVFRGQDKSMGRSSMAMSSAGSLKSRGAGMEKARMSRENIRAVFSRWYEQGKIALPQLTALERAIDCYHPFLLICYQLSGANHEKFFEYLFKMNIGDLIYHEPIVDMGSIPVLNGGFQAATPTDGAINHNASLATSGGKTGSVMFPGSVHLLGSRLMDHSEPGRGAGVAHRDTGKHVSGFILPTPETVPEDIGDGTDGRGEIRPPEM
ncbi:hypothetical protein HDU93_007791 [Gonapodya sp. JEL0774]|nr:hypothetical protein HDU93_007791 [Gonapodya sp. JEL0774]